jgi:hypothetical protein
MNKLTDEVQVRNETEIHQLGGTRTSNGKEKIVVKKGERVTT